MTTLRRQRRMFALLVALCCGGAAAPLFLLRAQAATTELVVVDWQTGLAIYGFDPVAYFTDRQPRLGDDRLELHHGGVIWRFRNEGNQAAFARDPGVYVPVYGGYDPMALAGGIARPGHPEFWTIYKQRLFLFFSPEALRDFERDPDAALLKADGRWPQVSRMLTP
jgi:hypothetical protein